MPIVELSRDEIEDAFCQMVSPIVLKGALPSEDCNKYGVDVLTNKHDPSVMMLHFVTQDRLEVNYEVDMMRLAREGKAYLDHWMGLLLDQLEQGRAFRQQENKIEIYTPPAKINGKSSTNELPKLKKSVVAHNKAVH